MSKGWPVVLLGLMLILCGCQHTATPTSQQTKVLSDHIQRWSSQMHASRAFLSYLKQNPAGAQTLQQFQAKQIAVLDAVARRHGVQLEKYEARQALDRYQGQLSEMDTSLLIADLVYCLALELRFGSIAPQWIDPSWRRYQNPELPVSVLKELGPSPYFRAKLELFAPQNPSYQRLASLLERTPLRSEPSLNNRYFKILANMERWRWLDSQLGQSYVIVNIASANLSLVHQGDTVLSSRVVVGRLARQTPVFSATIDELVWHPNWTVPATIWQQDILPKIARQEIDPHRSDYNFFRRQGGLLKPVSADQFVELDPTARKELILVQLHGPKNPLGPVKINFKNPYQIYLHGTPDQQQFDGDELALSSGCVRVEKAVELAKRLADLGGVKLPDLADDDRHVPVKLRYPIAVHITYFTLWVDRAGRVFEAPDRYQRDSLMASLLLHTGAKVKLHY